MSEAQSRNAVIGIACAVGGAVALSLNDLFIKQLSGSYALHQVILVRALVGIVFILGVIGVSGVGLASLRTGRPWAHVIRASVVMVSNVTYFLGLAAMPIANAAAIGFVAPILVTLISVLFLGERVGWRRWTAIGVGGIGVLIILWPDASVFTPLSLLPLGAAFLWSLYVLATRFVSRQDASAVSFLWTGVAAALAMTGPGLWVWVAMTPDDWAWMLALSCTSVTGHFLLIRAYDMAEASALQPLTYLQLVFISFFGVYLFGETLHRNIIVGAVIVVAAGLFTLWRQRVRARAT